jgi:hypothetical protein
VAAQQDHEKKLGESPSAFFQWQESSNTSSDFFENPEGIGERIDMRPLSNRRIKDCISENRLQ